MQDRAETFQYELKPFRVPGAPATLIEAGERPVYSMVNLNMIDAGSPLYGDVSAVFSNKTHFEQHLVVFSRQRFFSAVLHQRKDPFPGCRTTVAQRQHSKGWAHFCTTGTSS